MARILWVLGAGFLALVVVLGAFDSRGDPAHLHDGHDSRGAHEVPDSPRDDMRGIKVNGHIL
jgi:preprotein translocase subunit SecG